MVWYLSLPVLESNWDDENFGSYTKIPQFFEAPGCNAVQLGNKSEGPKYFTLNDRKEGKY